MDLENIKGLPVKELETFMEGIGHPAFRARQLFRWIYQKRETDFSMMSDLSKRFREDLSKRIQLPSLRIVSQENSKDGTIKYLLQLEDGMKVESVFIPTVERNTLCISTQVGCKMGCGFCATGHMGFFRNLKSWEIVDQYLMIRAHRQITNIVLMGMGEPLDNYDAIVCALKIFQDPMGPKIGKRHITLSTVGITPKIQQFVDSNLGNLAISLHATTEAQRSKIMPINDKYPMGDLLRTCRRITLRGRKRITFEYLLLKGINDSVDDARRLVVLLKGIPCKVNLLAYNPILSASYGRSNEETTLRFQKILIESMITATYRKSRGPDIAAACGQLKTERRRVNPIH